MSILPAILFAKPFVGSDADVILRSSDGVEFQAHKLILSYASPVFRDMFQIGDASSSNAHTPACKSELSIIDLTEPQHVLYHILHHCYPIPHNTPTTLDDLVPLLTAAVKYDMQGVLSLLQYALRPLRKTQMLQVYAIACRFGFERLAQEAAQLWKAHICPYSDASQSWNQAWAETTLGVTFVDEMKDMDAGSYCRLVKFLRTGSFVTFCAPDVIPDEQQQLPPATPFAIPRHSDADLQIQSTQSMDLFSVHGTVLAVCSPILKQEIDTVMQSCPRASKTDMPTLLLPECASTLRLLIGSCYPPVLARIRSSDIRVTEIPKFIDAAKKYQLEHLISFIRTQPSTSNISDPLSAYCVAVQCGWASEARNAAIRLARLETEIDYSSCLESINTASYFPLLKFCHEYRRIVRQLAGDQSYDSWRLAKWLWDEHEGDARDLAWTITNYIANSSQFVYRSRSGYGSYSRPDGRASDALAELKNLDQILRSRLSEVCTLTLRIFHLSFLFTSCLCLPASARNIVARFCVTYER